MKICVYAISKNEAKHVDRFMGSVLEADMVVVLDTGSRDGTVRKLRKRGARVFEHRFGDAFRFDAARNEALAHVPEDFDICVSLDLDETVEAGWRDKLEAAWAPGTTRAKYLYNWSFNPDGTPAVQYFIDKIHTRQNYAWKHAVHEYVENTAGSEVVVVAPITVNHFRDESKSRASYLPLLEIDFLENPNDTRAAHYLGREYMYQKRHNAAIAMFERYLSMPNAKWAAERCATRRFMARCLSDTGNLDEAEKQCLMAIAEAPYLREPYIDMAKVKYLQHDWEAVRYYAMRGLQCTDKTAGGYMNDADAWSWEPHDQISIACWNLGRYEEGRPHAQLAYDLSGKNDKRITANLDFYLRMAQG